LSVLWHTTLSSHGRGRAPAPCSARPSHPRRVVPSGACVHAKGSLSIAVMPSHHHHQEAPVLVRMKGEAPGRMQGMEAALRPQMARRAPHAGSSRYGLLQAPRPRAPRSSRSPGEALCLLLSADEGHNLTRQSDCLATVAGPSPAAHGRDWWHADRKCKRSCGPGVHERTPRAPTARTQDRLCVPLSLPADQLTGFVGHQEAADTPWGDMWSDLPVS
jgi:hypothetical protein